MRYGIKALILSFVMLMIAFPSYARNGNITINVSGVPMQTVLKKIEQQTEGTEKVIIFQVALKRD